jgi:hypothetical protein
MYILVCLQFFSWDRGIVGSALGISTGRAVLLSYIPY